MNINTFQIASNKLLHSSHNKVNLPIIINEYHCLIIQFKQHYIINHNPHSDHIYLFIALLNNYINLSLQCNNNRNKLFEYYLNELNVIGYNYEWILNQLNEAYNCNTIKIITQITNILSLLLWYCNNDYTDYNYARIRILLDKLIAVNSLSNNNNNYHNNTNNIDIKVRLWRFLLDYKFNVNKIDENDTKLLNIYHPYPLYLNGTLYYKKQDYANCIALLTQNIDKYTITRTHYNLNLLASSYAKLKQYKQAISAYESAINLLNEKSNINTDHDKQIIVGNLLCLYGQINKLSTCVKLNKLLPDNMDNKLFEARLLFKLKEYTPAISLYQSLLQYINQSNIQFYYEYLNLLLIVGGNSNYINVQNITKQLLNVYNGNTLLHIYQAEAIFKLNTKDDNTNHRTNQCVSILINCLDNFKLNENINFKLIILLNLCVIHTYNNMFDRALTYLNQALSINLSNNINPILYRRIRLYYSYLLFKINKPYQAINEWLLFRNIINLKHNDNITIQYYINEYNKINNSNNNDQFLQFDRFCLKYLIDNSNHNTISMQHAIIF